MDKYEYLVIKTHSFIIKMKIKRRFISESYINNK